MHLKLPSPLTQAAALSLFLGLAACSSSNDTASDETSEPSTAAANDTDTPSTADPDSPPDASSNLLLDFTAYIPDAVQISGVAVQRDTGLAALVTDHETVVLFDLAEQENVGKFSVQLGELPRQGSSEALSFGANEDIYVLYPDSGTLRAFSQLGEVQDTIELPEAEWMGGLAIDIETDHALLVRKTEGANEVVAFDLDDNTVSLEVPVIGPLAGAQIEGLSLATDGTAELLWVITKTSDVFTLNPMTGASVLFGRADAVEDASAIEAFVNVVDGSAEENLAIADDDNKYNEEPGPLRLYLMSND